MSRVVRRLDLVAVIGVFCVLRVLPAGVRRLASSDTANTAKLRGTVSELQVQGPADRHPPPFWVWRPPGPDSATIPVVYYLHGYPGLASDAFSDGVSDALNQLLEEG